MGRSHGTERAQKRFASVAGFLVRYLSHGDPRSGLCGPCIQDATDLLMHVADCQEELDNATHYIDVRIIESSCVLADDHYQGHAIFADVFGRDELARLDKGGEGFDRVLSQNTLGRLKPLQNTPVFLWCAP